ncbi:MAG: FAD-dependent oxidoreductase [Devosiaceae bacterium]|nr:FAD-dependent oxidoreductase [Devosiaceae bacterium]
MNAKPETDYDVIVAGGGAGGVGAALGAARAGAKTLLVEKYGFLGGAATNSQVLAYCGFFQQGKKPKKAVGGAGDLVLDALKILGSDPDAYCSETTGNWIILLDPEKVKLALDRVLLANGVDILLHTRVAAATRTANHIHSITLAGMDGRIRLSAEAFVDATGDANLALVAGIDCRQGNGKNQFQAASGPIRIGGLDADFVIERQVIVKAFEEYNTAGCKFPLTRHDGGIYTRVPGSSDMWWLMIDFPIQDLSSSSFTKAEIHMRAAANEYVAVLRENVAGFERAYLIQSGPQIGVRESRHPAARYDLSANDIRTGRKREDGIARAAWPMEDHSRPGNPVYEPVGGDGYAHIPMDCLRAKDINNLYYAGRVIGADPLAYASIRVMGTSFATGEAAGVAASMPNADTDQIRKQLSNGGSII